MRLKVNKIFQYTKEQEIIHTGEIEFTQTDIDCCNILIFDKIVYEENFSGKVIPLTEYMEKYSKAEFEILTEGSSGYSTIYSGWIRQEEKEPVSGIINIWNMGDVVYQIDE